MAIVLGTDVGEILVGTPQADTITGFAGDDIIYGLAGNDILYGGDGLFTTFDDDDDLIFSGGGADRLFGEFGNDTLVLDGPIVLPGVGVPVSIFDGGGGSDTLLLKHNATASPFSYGPLTNYGFAAGAIFSIERLQFDTQAGNSIQASYSLGAFSGTGISELVGGGGRDSMVFTVTAGGTYTTPSLTFTNWDTDGALYRAEHDIVTLVAVQLPVGPVGNYVLNAREGLPSSQVLIGAAGSDTLNGSSGTELLNGGGGVNQLRSFGGDDVLVISNSAVTAFTGAGSLFDGGEGIDTFGLNGTVDFQGEFVSIERLFFDPAFASPNPAAAKLPAHLILSGGDLAGLPHALLLEGSGTLTVNMTPGVAYDASAFVVAAGSTIAGRVNGTAFSDLVKPGAIQELVNGGEGRDTAQFAGNSSDYVISGAGPGGVVVLVGADIFVSVEQFRFADGQFRWDGTQLVNLTQSFGNGDDTAAGTELDDVLQGERGDDTLHGLAGNDQLYGGQGNDILDGGDEHDFLSGGRGEDILIGGEGADVFDFSGLDGDLGTGNDTIADFQEGLDSLAFAAGVGIRKELHGDFNGDGTADTQLVLTKGGTITLLGVSSYGEGDASGAEFFHNAAGHDVSMLLHQMQVAIV